MEKKVLDILGDINEELLTYTGSNMVNDDIVDSFELLSIISQLEDEFDIEINAKDVTEENFGNKDRIIAMLRRMGKE